MDNTIKHYVLEHPYALEPRIKKPKSKQANAIYTALFALQNSYLRHVTLVFCVASNSTVLCSSNSAPFLPKVPHHG